MIIEWLTSKFTPASPLARFVGYVNSSVALSHRYQRCRRAWATHVEACHQTILAEKPASAKKVLIVGSGPLHEIPIEELMQDQNCEVTLVDVVHPISSRRKVKKFGSRIRLIELDVTGVAHLLQGSEGLRKIENLQFRPPQKSERKELDVSYDYVVSANLISQLPLDPFARLEKTNAQFAQDDFFSRLAKKMGDQHVEWIESLGAKALLITDVQRTYFDRKGQETERVESAYVTHAGKLIKRWDWMISPLGESSRSFSYTMQVEARVL